MKKRSIILSLIAIAIILAVIFILQYNNLKGAFVKDKISVGSDEVSLYIHDQRTINASGGCSDYETTIFYEVDGQWVKIKNSLPEISSYWLDNEYLPGSKTNSDLQDFMCDGDSVIKDLPLPITLKLDGYMQIGERDKKPVFESFEHPAGQYKVVISYVNAKGLPVTIEKIFSK